MARLPEAASAVPLYRVERLATSDFGARGRFDAWRAAAYELVDLVPPEERRDAYRARKRTIRGARGAFGTHASDPHRTAMAARAGAQAGDGASVVLSVMLRGEVRLTKPDGSTQLMPAGYIAAYDPFRPMRYDWSAGREAYLVVPRRAGWSLPRGADAAFATPFDRHPLAPFVLSQLRLLDRGAERLGPVALAAAVDGLVDMATAMLGDGLAERLAGRDVAARALHAAGLRCIADNAHRPHLNAEAIARAIGCSRATLYRAFQAEGTTVMDAVRAARLDRAHAALRARPDLAIAAIAQACGFAGPAALSRSFRARYGLSPSEWRHLAAS